MIDVVSARGKLRRPVRVSMTQEKNSQCPICIHTLPMLTETIAELPRMSKYEIIDCIMTINKTARQDFLDQFTTEDLDQYLEHLMQVDLEEIALCA